MKEQEFKNNYSKLPKFRKRKGANISGKEVWYQDECKYVYRILCISNGKSYIGRSSNPVCRIHQHIIALQRHRHKNKNMQMDFDKYGIEKFDFQLLGEEIFSTNYKKEMQEYYKTYIPEFGYNEKDTNWRWHTN